MDKNNLLFKTATVHVAGSSVLVPQQVFIIWYYRKSVTDKWTRYRKTFNLNRIENFKHRRKAADAMCETINSFLKKGINPANLDESPAVNDFANDFANVAIAIKKAYSNIKLRLTKDRSISSYNNHFKHFNAYLKKVGLLNYPLTDFTKQHAVEYQSALINEGLANKTINTKVEFASNLFKELVNIDKIEINPFIAVKRLKLEQKKIELFTKAEIQTIKDHLLKECPALWQFALFIYYCYMRPESIVNLKKQFFDFEKNLLFIPAEIHKNSKDSYKQILAPHRKYLVPFLMNISNDHYIFSSHLKAGKQLIAPTRASELWKKYVKEDLGISKNMYLLKDTGAVHYLEANKGKENMKWLQMQMSHSDLQTTSIYTNKQAITLLTEEEQNKMNEI